MRVTETLPIVCMSFVVSVFCTSGVMGLLSSSFHVTDVTMVVVIVPLDPRYVLKFSPSFSTRFPLRVEISYRVVKMDPSICWAITYLKEGPNEEPSKIIVLAEVVMESTRVKMIGWPGTSMIAPAKELSDFLRNL